MAPPVSVPSAVAAALGIMSIRKSGFQFGLISLTAEEAVWRRDGQNTYDIPLASDLVPAFDGVQLLLELCGWRLTRGAQPDEIVWRFAAAQYQNPPEAIREATKRREGHSLKATFPHVPSCFPRPPCVPPHPAARERKCMHIPLLPLSAFRSLQHPSIPVE